MRRYIPKIGATVKLQKWEHYRLIDQALVEHDQLVQRTHNEVSCALRMDELTEAQAKELEEKIVAELRAQHAEYCKTHDLPSMWAWFIVLVASEKTCRIQHTSRAVSAPDPPWEGDVPTKQIDPPLGWKPVYEIVCKDKKQADKVVSEWFKRGIHVWTSADLSSGGRKSFTPFGAAGATQDEPASPHWQFTKEPTESIPPELCPQLFMVKVFEEWEPKLPEGNKEKAMVVETLRKSGVEVQYIKSERMWIASRETTIYQPRE
jgi:hypothetical protein